MPSGVAPLVKAVVERGDIDVSEARARVREALKKPHPLGEIRKFKLSELTIDKAYQRVVSPRMVRDIVTNFREELLGVATIGMRGGKFHLIDGATRAAALGLMGYPDWYGVAIETSSVREEAWLFVQLNTERRALLPQQLFAARLVAGDKMAQDIDKLIRRYNFKFNDPGIFVHKIAKDTIVAIGSLYHIYEKHGLDQLDSVLATLRRGWKGDPTAMSAAMIRGISRFYTDYDVEPAELIRAIKDTNADAFELLARANRTAHNGKMSRIDAVADELDKLLG